MTLAIINIILSTLTSFGLYFGLGCTVMPEWLTWAWCWLPIAFFVGSILVYDLLWVNFLIIGGLFINTKKERGMNKFGLWVLRQTAHEILFYCNVKAHVTGMEKLPKDEKYLGIFNHSSAWDAILMYTYLDTLFISKKGNVKDFLVGPWIALSGCISIDKENLFSSLASIKKAAAYLSNDQINVCVSPEGTRSKQRQLLPFHAVVFEAAKIAKKPIVIFALQNCQVAGKRMILRHTNVYMDVVDVIPYETYKTMKTAELSEMCREKLLAHLTEHKDRLVLKDGIE